MPRDSENNLAALACQPPTPTDGRAFREVRAALVIAHPGHELCVYGWIAKLRPRVFVLTDGSGHSRTPRIRHTTAILDRLGAAKGTCYGRFTDAEIYQALLKHDYNIFAELAAEIAEALVKEEVTCVIGDPSEGFNPTHDACRVIVDAAVARARERHDRTITNLEFAIDGQPNRSLTGSTVEYSSVNLDNYTFAEKLGTARNYPGVNEDVENLVRKYSAEAFRIEYLYRADNGHEHTAADQKPFYEEYGAQRVREGYYEQVIRYREHLLPLARNLLGENGDRSA